MNNSDKFLLATTNIGYDLANFANIFKQLPKCTDYTMVLAQYNTEPVGFTESVDFF